MGNVPSHVATVQVTLGSKFPTEHHLLIQSAPCSSTLEFPILKIPEGLLLTPTVAGFIFRDSVCACVQARARVCVRVQHLCYVFMCGPMFVYVILLPVIVYSIDVRIPAVVTERLSLDEQ
jgi:hypothetical protein